MEDVLERSQCKEDGSASDEYLINEEFMTMLDYYVAACLSVRASEAAGFRSFYAERVLLYTRREGKKEILEAGAVGGAEELAGEISRLCQQEEVQALFRVCPR